MPLLELISNRILDSIDNPRLVCLKQKTLGWRFTVVYIPGKRLGGTDALSRYGVHHCQTEGAAGIIENPHQWGPIAEYPENISSLNGSPSDAEEGTRKHLVGLLASSSTQHMTTSVPLLMDSDTYFLARLSSDMGPVL